jgi:hypothetical protein
MMTISNQQKTKPRIKPAVIHFKDPFDDESSSFFLSDKAPFPWAVAHHVFDNPKPATSLHVSTTFPHHVFDNPKHLPTQVFY